MLGCVESNCPTWGIRHGASEGSTDSTATRLDDQGLETNEGFVLGKLICGAASEEKGLRILCNGEETDADTKLPFESEKF